MQNKDRRYNMVLCCGIAVAMVVPWVQSAWGQNIISIQQIRPDRACGPRCLLALARLTGVGRQDCDLKCIYDMIGKQPLSATTLKDLKDAAEQMGFTAEGHRLNIKGLRKTDGYAILAIGLTDGKTETPLHFVLLKGISENHAIVVDPTMLVSMALPIDELNRVWTGYALVLTSGDGRTPLPKAPDDPNISPTINTTNPDGLPEQIWDFGMAENGLLLEHTFIVHHAEDGPCKVDILGKSCTCVEAALGEDTHGNATLTLKLRVNQPAWQKASVKLTLTPPGVTRIYAVKAFGRQMFRLNPSEGYVEVSSPDPVEYRVQAYYYTDANDFAVFNRIQSSVPNLRAQTVRSERIVSPRNAENVTYAFDIPLVYQVQVEDGSPRTIVDNVEFVFDTAKGERLVPLKLTTKIGAERMRVFPERVFLMITKADTSAQRKVKLSLLQKPYPANVQARLNGNLPLEVGCTRLADDQYMASITILSDKLNGCAPGRHEGEIVFVADNGEELVRVPALVLIRP